MNSNNKKLENSMMKKYQEKTKLHTEHMAMEMLTTMTPDFGTLLRQYILQETEFKPMIAYEVLCEYKKTFSKKAKAFSVNRNICVNNIQREQSHILLSNKQKISLEQFIKTLGNNKIFYKNDLVSFKKYESNEISKEMAIMKRTASTIKYNIKPKKKIKSDSSLLANDEYTKELEMIAKKKKRN